MSETIKIGPVTRIEGHLDVDVTVDKVGGRQQVVDAKCSGTMFRGFEIMLQGRAPRDASHYTQRICGVCPIAHGMASALALEAAFGIVPPDNGRIERNLVLGSNFVQSHILHFYHLAAPDYVDAGSVLPMSPWIPRYTTSDMLTGAAAKPFVDHYVQALAMRRKAHQMGAIFGGRMPCSPDMLAGGCSEAPTAQKVNDFLAILTELQAFINNVYIKDVQAVAKVMANYATIGKGCGNLLAYGVFDLDAAGNNKLLARGRFTRGRYASVDPTQIKEYVGSSWYTPASGNKNPSVGVTEPQPDKGRAYSYLKAPRYQDVVHEVGPLARMWVNGDYRKGPSVLDRLMARAMETKKIADAMVGWAKSLHVGRSNFVDKATPATGSGIGLTEALRGALGHWLQIANSKISRYQILTPTCWNASPRDDRGQLGAIEQALLGTPVKDTTQPIEVLRVVHSFDPCLACAVHLARPGKKAQLVSVR